jgi:IS605 OrfB family transposase
MQLVEKHIISKSHAFYKECDRLCFLSKNLYNAGLYAIRQHYFETGKFLNYESLKKRFQNDRQPDYYALNTKVSQWVLKLLCQNFNSFFKANQDFKNNPHKYLGKPKIPKYKYKTESRNVLTFTIQVLSKVLLKQNKIVLGGTAIQLPTKIKATFQAKTLFQPEKSNIAQVRIVPKKQCYVIEIIYEKQEAIPVKKLFAKKIVWKVGDILNLANFIPSNFRKPIIFGYKNQNLDKKKVAGIDLGLANLATVASNEKIFKAFLISGKVLQRINHYFNKKKAKLMSLVGDSGTSRRIEKLTHKRNCKIADYLHKSSRLIINQLIENRVGKLIIGYNPLWKQEINLGTRTNQKFVSIPYADFIHQLQYKAKLAGIEVQIQEESYTSKCSFLDLEPIRKHTKYTGRRTQRGLFVSSTGIKINADLNGAYNIIRKAVPNAFGNGIQGVVVHPYRYFSIK